MKTQLTRAAQVGVPPQGPLSEQRRISAVHEAGHAVAAVMCAAELGYKRSEAIIYIDMGLDPAKHAGGRGNVPVSGGATVGRAVSREMWFEAQSSLAGQWMEVIKDPFSPKTRAKIIQAARVGGVDVEKWFRAKAFVAVAGSVAEAIFVNRPFARLFWTDSSVENDRASVAFDAEIGGFFTARCTPDDQQNGCCFCLLDAGGTDLGGSDEFSE